MANSDKAWCWSASDCSDGEVADEKLAARFNSVEGATQFKEAFDAARVFNKTAHDGKDDELVWAEAIEDVQEVVEDDIETNKTAAGGDEGDD